MASAEQPLSEVEARLISQDFRRQFRNSDAFEQAWHALFELRSAITPTLARRFLREELVKFRAHTVGLEVRDFEPPATVVPQPPERDFECPECHCQMGEWDRSGHAAECPHTGCYALEVRARIGIARRNAAIQAAKRGT
jgi:hypothetical protein